MRQNTGFTVLELVMAIAILAILASIAVSAYQTYTIRGEVTDAISAAATVQAPVVETFERTGSPPANRVDAGLSADSTDTRADYVSQIQVVNGRVDITFGNQAHPDITNKTLSLTPYVTASGVIWRCGQATAPEGRVMGEGGSNPATYQTGDIDARYLPSGCR